MALDKAKIDRTGINMDAFNAASETSDPNAVFPMANGRLMRPLVRLEAIGETNANRAEIAAEAAAAVANLVPTIAAGLASTSGSGATNRYFSFIDQDGVLIPYRNDAGVAVDIGYRVATRGMIDAVSNRIDALGLRLATNVRSTDGLNYVLALLDAFGQSPFGVSDSGELHIGGLYVQTGASPFPLSVSTPDGRALLLIDKAGELWHAWMPLEADTGMPVEPTLRDDLLADGMTELQYRPASITALINVGQSNSIGTENGGSTASQGYSNIMLASGMNRNSSDPGYNASSFAPMREIAYPDGDRYETGIQAWTDMMVQRAMSRGETQADNVYFGHSAGVQGVSIEQLLEGAVADLFKYFTQPLTSASSLAQASGKGINLTALHFDQGEQDIYIDTSQADYYNRALLYYAQLGRAARLATEQNNIPVMLATQKTTNLLLGKPRNPVAIAQRQLSLEIPGIILSHPDYCLDGMAPSGIHYNALAQRESHRYVARALDYLRTTGRKWVGVDVTSIQWQGTSIEIGIHDPAGRGLRLDTTRIAAAPNYGFDLWSASSGGLLGSAITAIVVRPYGVSITTAANLPADVEVVAGRGRPGDPQKVGRLQGPRINICDRYSEIESQFDLDNYMLCFNHFRSQGNF